MANGNNMLTIVDIIPRYSPIGQFTKISDKHAFGMNNKVNTLLNYIQSIEGHNSMYPKLGAFKLLNSIPYTQDLNLLMSKISSRLSNDLDMSLEVTYDKDPKKMDFIILNIEVLGLPGILQVDVKKSDDVFKIINPRYIKREDHI